MNDEARWRAMTAESKRLHDKLMPESVLEREVASWLACTAKVKDTSNQEQDTSENKKED